MLFHRTILVACSALFATVLSSAALAQCGSCGGWGVSAAVACAPAPVYWGGCGGCGSVAVAVQPVVEVQPVVVQPVVEAVPIVPAPIAVGWSGGCGCGSCGGCGSTFGYQSAVVASPYYVVNQGPVYSGPGVMVPFGTYSPTAGLSNPAAYPYVGGSGLWLRPPPRSASRLWLRSASWLWLRLWCPLRLRPPLRLWGSLRIRQSVSP